MVHKIRKNSDKVWGMLVLLLLLEIFLLVQGEISRSKACQGDAYAETKIVALTFDDGPHPTYTTTLLDGLQERGVKVSFFVTGEHADLHPEVIQRMAEEGHLVGNHTYSHIGLTKSNEKKFRDELAATSELLEKLTGKETAYVRPPYGTWNKKLEKECNLIPVLWNVDSMDWSLQDVAKIKKRVLRSVKDGSIILMHDYFDTSVIAALEIVDELLKQGYTFVTVDEMVYD